MSVSDLSRIDFHPLTFVDDADGVVVGRSDATSYAVLPADGAALLRRLAEGTSPHEAAAWYEAQFGESVDMEDFIDTLRELGFVRAAGERPAEAARVRLQRLGAAAFSPVAWLCYAGLLTAAVLMMVRHPELRPHARNVFFTPSLLLVQLVVTLAQVPAVGWHESFHVLAGRRLHIPTRLGVGRRLYFVVFEAHIDGLLGVARRKRYLPFLAGMVADVLLFSALTLVAQAGTWAGRLALAVAYTVLLRLSWQFYVFLRTDLYFVFTTLLGCTNLHEVTSVYLRGRLARLPGVRPPTQPWSSWSPRDRRVAPWFAALTVVGVGFLLATTAFAVIPVVTDFARRLGTELARGTAGGALFWDSLASVALLFVQFGLPVLIQRGGGTGPRAPEGESA